MRICEAGRDPCGCNNWSKGIRTIDGQYPDDNRDFNLQAGDGIEITPVTAGVEISVKAPLPGPMVFRGTVGTGGTIATLPDANVDNIGWAYVAVSAGTTPDDTPKSYAVGDMLVSDGAEWTVIPAGDDPVAWSQITGTPTTLSGYGITDAVTLNTEQTITERKTFARTGTGFSDTRLKGNRTSGNICGVHGYDGNDTLKGQVNFANDGVKIAFESNTPSLAAFNGYSTSAVRTYNSANVNDIVTIGSLASNPNVVHTTGNETMAGTLTINNVSGLYIQSGGSNRSHMEYQEIGGYATTILSVVESGGNAANISIAINSGGSAKLELNKRVGGVWTTSTIATL